MPGPPPFTPETDSQREATEVARLLPARRILEYSVFGKTHQLRVKREIGKERGGARYSYRVGFSLAQCEVRSATEHLGNLSSLEGLNPRTTR